MRSHAIRFAVIALLAFASPGEAALSGNYSFTTSQTGNVTITPFNNASFTVPAGPAFCVGPNLNNCISSGLSGTVAFNGNQIVFSFFGGTQSATGTFSVRLFDFVPGNIASVTYNSGALVTGSFTVSSFTANSVVFTGVVDNGTFSASNGRTLVFDVTTLTPPIVSKAFNPVRIAPAGTSTLTVSIRNPNPASALNGVGLVDNLPNGVTVATPNGLANACGGTVTAAPGAASITLAGGAIPAGGTCTVAVKVTSTEGTKNNVTAAVTYSGGTGNTAQATLTAIAPPVLTKAFAAPSLESRGTTGLIFSLRNPNASLPLSGLAFTDTLPAGLVVATPPGLSGNCGGGTIVAAAGTKTISLSGAALAAGVGCTFSLNVTSDGTVLGSLTNTTGTVNSTEAGSGEAATAKILVVLDPPLLSAAFAPNRIAPGATSTLNLSVRNPNVASVLNGLGVVANLPPGVTVASPNGLSNTCGGTVAAAAGATSVTLAGGSIAASTVCTVAVRVTSNEGVKSLVTGAVSYSGGTGNTASATLSAAAPPALSRSFGALSIGHRATTTMTFTLKNPNASQQLTGLALTDLLPPGLTVATPAGVTGTCGSAAHITAEAGSGRISIANAALLPGASCTITVNVASEEPDPGYLTDSSASVTSTEAIAADAAPVRIFVGDPYAVRFSIGDSVMNVLNAGSAGAGIEAGTTASVTGSICANIFAFAPDEQLISCCSCPVTPNGLVSMNVKRDILINTLTASVPESLVIKIVGTTPIAGSCVGSAAAVESGTLAHGLVAFGTASHPVPTPGLTGIVETPFSSATLSASDLSRMGNLCTFILANGSGFGVCRACRLGGQGGDKL